MTATELQEILEEVSERTAAQVESINKRLLQCKTDEEMENLPALHREVLSAASILREALEEIGG